MFRIGGRIFWMQDSKERDWTKERKCKYCLLYSSGQGKYSIQSDGVCLRWKSTWFQMYNNYSMSPSWIWSDKITNERVARVGYNHFISKKGEWNNCFSKFSNWVLPPIFISTILQSGKFLNLAHYFPYDVKLRLLAHSRSFVANQKARNAIVGAENLLNAYIWASSLD